MFTLLATMLPVSQDVMETAWEDFKYEDDPAYKSSMQREFFYRALNVLYNCMWYSNMNFKILQNFSKCLIKSSSFLSKSCGRA